MAKEDAARSSLLADIQALCEQAHQVAALNTLRKFARDRLTYRQERVDQGIDLADTLWSEAEAMQRAEHDWQRESGKLATRRLTLARQYGGSERIFSRGLIPPVYSRYIAGCVVWIGASLGECRLGSGADGAICL